ncbi:hypothetical protein FS837_000601 [Tulasnella sp. UAMH 9824]|nr:hypothetical protein FS837_000601 [Tulasnella sp. UAMH 9824]
MFGNFLSARRQTYTATTPSSQFLPESTPSKFSSLVLKLRRLARPSSQPRSQEKNASQSYLEPQHGFQPPALPSQGFSAVTQCSHTSLDRRPHGPYLSQPAVPITSSTRRTEDQNVVISTPPTGGPRSTFSTTTSPLLTPPQLVDTTPTISFSPIPPTFQSSQQTAETLAENKKLEKLKATIERRSLRNANYALAVQYALRDNIVPGVTAFAQERDSLNEEVKRTEEHLAKGLKARSELKELRGEKLKQRRKVEEAVLAAEREHEEKQERCYQLKKEITRFILEAKKRKVRPPRTGLSDSGSGSGSNPDPDSEDDYGVPTAEAASPRSLKKAKTASSFSDGLESPNWFKRGLLFGAARQRPSTRGSDSTEFEMFDTSQPPQAALSDSGPHTQDGDGDGSDEYADDFA